VPVAARIGVRPQIDVGSAQPHAVLVPLSLSLDERRRSAPARNAHRGRGGHREDVFSARRDRVSPHLLWRF
jgi:hypothetical protein